VVASISGPYGMTQDLAGHVYVTSQGINGFVIYDNSVNWTQVGSCSMSK